MEIAEVCWKSEENIANDNNMLLLGPLLHQYAHVESRFQRTRALLGSAVIRR